MGGWKFPLSQMLQSDISLVWASPTLMAKTEC